MNLKNTIRTKPIERSIKMNFMSSRIPKIALNPSIVLFPKN